jgi:flagellar biosynthesis protein FlhB
VVSTKLLTVAKALAKPCAFVLEDLYRAVAEVLAFVYDQKKIKIFG